VSSSVTDLIVGSGLLFVDRAGHSPKGVPPGSMKRISLPSLQPHRGFNEPSSLMARPGKMALELSRYGLIIGRTMLYPPGPDESKYRMLGFGS